MPALDTHLASSGDDVATVSPKSTSYHVLFPQNFVLQTRISCVWRFRYNNGNGLRRKRTMSRIRRGPAFFCIFTAETSRTPSLAVLFFILLQGTGLFSSPLSSLKTHVSVIVAAHELTGACNSDSVFFPPFRPLSMRKTLPCLLLGRDRIDLAGSVECHLGHHWACDFINQHAEKNYVPDQ